MATTSQTARKEKAWWDETNTGIFLQLLVEEIDAGNRPGGQFTKLAWKSITKKFAESSGCNFTQSQLKNKWDNLRKDFILWEKLLHNEKGLGYDHTTGKIVVDAVWWRQKLLEKPEYRKFKTHGPMHLFLQEKIFKGKGMAATGFMEYLPSKDLPLGQGQRLDEIPENIQEISAQSDQNEVLDDVAEQQASPKNMDPPNANTRMGTNIRKRKRSRSANMRPTDEDVNANMMDLIDVRKQAESASSVHKVQASGEIAYGESIRMLRALPWLDINSPYFLNALVLLKDPNNRIAFKHIIELGEEFFKKWVRKLDDTGLEDL